MNDVIVTKLIECAFTILTIVITSVLLPALTAWLKSKTNNEKLKGMVDDISQTVRTCVDCCEQTTVATLKKSGKWDAETQADVRNSVILQTLDCLLSSTKTYAEANDINLNVIVEQYIEAYIQSKKAV